jgi:hypothetical protein
MKLSTSTLQILKNFSYINKSIIVKEGHELVTVADNTTVIGYAEIEEEFPKDFAIYDLDKFINSINLFKEPDLEFFDNKLRITSSDSNIEYFYADPDVLTQPPKNKFTLPSVDVELLLTAEHMSAIGKTSNNLDLPDISVQSDGKKMKLLVHNKSIQTGNKFSIDFGESDLVFSVNLKISYLKFLPGSYYLEISSKGICQFTHQDIGLSYFIATEKDSKFN